MWAVAAGLLAFGLVYSADVASEGTQCSGTNSTCSESCQGSNGTCAGNNSTSCQGNGTCAESRNTQLSCADDNCPTAPANGSSRLLPGISVEGNGTSEKPLSATAHFSPSPFLGVIPDRPGSLVIGEVFQDTVGPRQATVSFQRHRQSTVAFPPQRPIQEYARPRDTYVNYQQPDVEIHLGPDSYDRPDYDSAGRPYEPPQVDITIPTNVFSRPDEGKSLRPTTATGPDNLGGKGYSGQVGFGGYPVGGPKQPFYDGYENVKNLIKPVKNPPPYQFEPSFGSMKPIQEDTGEPPHYSQPFPPAGSEPSYPLGGPELYHSPGSDGSPEAYNHYIAEQGKEGPSKWKGLLRFAATLLPFGLLLAALSPNILVISPAEDGDTTTKQHHQGHRALQSSSGLGPCGLRKLCEALSTSPEDFQVFLKAAKQGSTPELQEIIKKAEEKDCSSLGCLELKPTQSTFS